MQSREPSHATTAPPATSSAWKAAFDAQCTQDLLTKARRYAERRARKLRQIGGFADDYYVHEIVQDVVGDTYNGTLRWDPDTESLEEHVLDAVATRIHHDVSRARRFPHASVDDADPDVSQATLAAVDAALIAAREASPATVRFSENTLGELGELAASDADLQRLLGALAAGATSKDDVMFVTGMTDAEYRATRSRLERLTRRSPARARLAASPKKARVTKASRRPAPPPQAAVPCAAAHRELPDGGAQDVLRV